MSSIDLQIIVYGAIALIGIAALVGKMLNKRDMKRGYCDL